MDFDEMISGVFAQPLLIDPATFQAHPHSTRQKHMTSRIQINGDKLPPRRSRSECCVIHHEPFRKFKAIHAIYTPNSIRFATDITISLNVHIHVAAVILLHIAISKGQKPRYERQCDQHAC